MKFCLLALSTLTAVAYGSEDRLALRRRLADRRRLSYEKIAGYSPGSQVTDHCAIDLDQKAIEAQLAKGTPEAFQAALNIYKFGGNSKSYAEITLGEPLKAAIGNDQVFLGKSADGTEVAGLAYQNYAGGETKIKVQYATTDIQSDYVNCQVGGLVPELANMVGCFADTGDITIQDSKTGAGTTYSYVYNASTDNKNGRSIQGFSTQAREKMLNGCKGCPYKDYSYFNKYYEVDDYANQWVMAAINGESTSFARGNADFSKYSNVGQAECAKKGTAYMNTFMYVIREFEDALDDCVSDCINCNDDPVHAWDEGVCFYTGSIEGQDGLTTDGKLLHQLADKRCQDYRKCGPEGDQLTGTASINYEIFDLFAMGNFQLTSGNCHGARETTKLIVDLMYVPLIQGTMRYAYKVDKLQGGEKEKAEGAVFAAAVLPRIYAANQDAATTIYNNMGVGASSTNFKDVKAAFESVFPDLGITCADIGGLWNTAEENYYQGMEPCKDHSTQKVVVEEDKTLATILGSVFGALFGLALIFICCMRRKEKQNAPIFAPYEQNGDGKEEQFS